MRSNFVPLTAQELVAKINKIPRVSLALLPTILEFAPEDGFILTDYKSFDWGEGQRLLAVSVHIHDKMTITGMGKMDIPVSGIGDDEELLKIKTFDSLPYKIQHRTLFTLIEPLDSLGYKRLDHWP